DLLIRVARTVDLVVDVGLREFGSVSPLLRDLPEGAARQAVLHPQRLDARLPVRLTEREVMEIHAVVDDSDHHAAPVDTGETIFERVQTNGRPGRQSEARVRRARLPRLGP